MLAVIRSWRGSQETSGRGGVISVYCRAPLGSKSTPALWPGTAEAMERMRSTIRLAAALLLLVPGTARAEDVAKFYEGKQIRLIIGADVGGPYDAYARLLSRYIIRHIPGNPRLVVQNMPGATAVIA